MWLLSLLLGLLVVLAITAATGYFVAQEFAYMTVDRSRLNARAAAGDASASRAVAVTRRTSFMLSGAQLGITITALLVGFVAEPLVGEALGTGLGGIGVPTGVGVGIGTAAALLLSTGVQMVFGELFPKNLAIARPEQTAVALARSTQLYLAVFGWLIAFFDKSSNALLKLFGMEPVHDVEHAATRRDLGHIVAESRDSGDLPVELSHLLARLVDFPDRDVAHAMVPRARVGVVSDDTPLEALWTAMGDGHSRCPVLDAVHDVVGVVHLQDLLAEARREHLTVADIMRAPLLVPTSMPLPDALRELVAGDDRLACVLDEHGGLAGVLTVEDLAEELVGEIDDEHDGVPDVGDPDPEPVIDDLRTSWELAGALPLDEVARIVDRDLPAGRQQTLGGLVIAGLGRLPQVGDSVTVTLASVHSGDTTTDEQVVLEVLGVRRHVPSLVRVDVAGAGRRRRGRHGGGGLMDNPWVFATVTVALIALSAFFVAAEFAVLAARRHRVEEQAAAGSRAARAAVRSIDELTVLLAGCQLGITACALGLGAITKPAVNYALTPAFESWGLPGWAADASGFALALAVVTFLHLVIGEMAPKSWAIAHPETAAVALAIPMRGFMWLTRPLLRVLNETANWCLRRVGVEPRDTVASGQTPADLRQLVEHSANVGALDAAFSDQVADALDLEHLTLGDLVEPGREVVAVSPDATMVTVRDAARTTGHLRIPLRDADGGLGGMVHVRDTMNRPDHTRASDLRRDVLSLPAETLVHTALATMRTSRVHLVVVATADGPAVLTLDDLVTRLLPGPEVSRA